LAVLEGEHPSRLESVTEVLTESWPDTRLARERPVLTPASLAVVPSALDHLISQVGESSEVSVEKMVQVSPVIVAGGVGTARILRRESGHPV
jgi:hypothetical protein